MTPEFTESLLPSREAMRIVHRLIELGGAMRLKPLLRDLGMDTRVFIDALNDLKERCWITFVWRKELPGAAEVESRPHTEMDRLVVTWLGRRRYRQTWWMV